VELIPCCISVCICTTRLSGFFDKCYSINLIIIRNYKTYEIAVLSKMELVAGQKKSSTLMSHGHLGLSKSYPASNVPSTYRTFKASHQNILQAL
jgi:hypothetical protein